MNPVIEISNGKTSRTSTKGNAKSGTASTEKKEFEVLLSMFGSSTKDSGKNGKHSKTEATGKGDATSETSDSKGSGSAAQKGSISFLKLEEQLLEAITSGKQKSKPGKKSSVKSESVSSLITAGMSFITAYRSGSAKGTAEPASTILAKAERDMIAAQKANSGNSDSEGKSKPAEAGIAAQTKSASGNSESTGKGAVGSDILKLMTAASSGKVDEKTLKELNGLLAKAGAGNAGSVKSLAQKVKADAAVISNQEDLPALKAASRQTTAVKGDPSGAITSSARSSLRSAVAGTDQAKQAEVTTASAGQTGNQGDRQAISGTQGTNGQTQAAPKQDIPVHSSRFEQNNQNFNDRGSNNQADASNFGSTQVYSPAMNASAPNTSFTQALSATAQNFSNAAMTTNLQQLTQGIVKQVSMMTLQGKKVVNVKLQPESLGSLTLQVVSDGGKISAQFNVRTTDARAFLEASTPQMKQMLETNGVTLAHLSVNLSGGEFQSGNPRQEYKPRKQYMKYINDTSDTVAAPAPTEFSRSFGYNTMEMQV